MKTSSQNNSIYTLCVDDHELHLCTSECPFEWRSSYVTGGCEAYSSWFEGSGYNHDFCTLDAGKGTHLTAADCCTECNQCKAPVKEKVQCNSECPSSDEFLTGYGTCDTYAPFGENHEYCHDDRDIASNLLAVECCLQCDRCDPNSPHAAPDYPADVWYDPYYGSQYYEPPTEPCDSSCPLDFMSEYGDCDSYMWENWGFCHEDYDMKTGHTAAECCGPCGLCYVDPSIHSAVPTPAPVQPEPCSSDCAIDWKSWYGDCTAFHEDYGTEYHYCFDTWGTGLMSNHTAAECCSECNQCYIAETIHTVAPTSAPSLKWQCNSECWDNGNSTWSSWYGECADYDVTGYNHEYCDSDTDEWTGLFASECCSECNQCLPEGSDGIDPDLTPIQPGDAIGSACAGSVSDWDVGYGGCETYAPGMDNAEFCLADMGENGLYAHQVCSECGDCVDIPECSHECPHDFRTYYDTCAGYAVGEFNHDYCEWDADMNSFDFYAEDCCTECGKCISTHHPDDGHDSTPSPTVMPEITEPYMECDSTCPTDGWESIYGKCESYDPDYVWDYSNYYDYDYGSNYGGRRRLFYGYGYDYSGWDNYDYDYSGWGNYDYSGYYDYYSGMNHDYCTTDQDDTYSWYAKDCCTECGHCYMPEPSTCHTSTKKSKCTKRFAEENCLWAKKKKECYMASAEELAEINGCTATKKKKCVIADHCVWSKAFGCYNGDEVDPESLCEGLAKSKCKKAKKDCQIHPVDLTCHPKSTDLGKFACDEINDKKLCKAEKKKCKWVKGKKGGCQDK